MQTQGQVQGQDNSTGPWARVSQAEVDTCAVCGDVEQTSKMTLDEDEGGWVCVECAAEAAEDEDD